MEELNTQIDAGDQGFEQGIETGDPAEISVSDLIQEVDGKGAVDNTGAAAETDAPDTHSDGAQPEQTITNQKDFNAALHSRLQDERSRLSRRYESSPEYQLGKQLLAERMAKEGISAQEAASRIRVETNQQKAERYAKNPQEFFADYLAQQNRPKEQPQAIQDPASDIGAQLVEADRNGLTPQGFTPDAVTPDFISDVQEFGLSAAFKMWERGQAQVTSRQQIAAELQRRQTQPQPMRTTNSNVASKPVDFTNMSEAEWKRYEAEIDRRLAAGQRVRL